MYFWPDLHRKIGIVGFARQTRLQLVRLLALVKWAGSSDSVQKCSVSPMISKITVGGGKIVGSFIIVFF